MLNDTILSLGILLSGIVFVASAYDQTLMPRHIAWCVLALVLCRNVNVGKIHIPFVGLLVFTLLAPVVNQSEWLYAVLRLCLVISFLSVLDIDEKIVSKTMIVFGLIFTAFFWNEYRNVGGEGMVGLMMQPNYSSASCFLVLPFCYYAIKNQFWTKTAWATTASMTLCIALLGCKSVMIALVISSFILDVRLGVTLLALTVFVAINNYDHLMYCLQLRLVQWHATLSMIGKNPLGAGNFLVMFPKYAAGIDYPNAYINTAFRFPHNDYLWIWAETGIGGIICYISIFVTAIWKAKRYVVFGLVGYMSIAFFTSLHERAFPSMMLVILIAIGTERKKQINCSNLLIVVLTITLIVFGFRLRSDIYNKELRSSVLTGNQQDIDPLKGYSPFSTLLYDGRPYYWWAGAIEYPDRKSKLKKAYEQNPNNIYVLNGMGVACLPDSSAEQYFDEAIRICPSYEEAKINKRN